MMDSMMRDYLKRRMGARGLDDAELSAPKSTDNVLPELDLSDGSDANLLDLSAAAPVGKLRDDNTDSDTIAPKTHSGDSASAVEVMAKATPQEWRTLGDMSRPPLVQGDDEQSRQVWEYLKAKMDDGGGRLTRNDIEDEMKAGAYDMAAALGRGVGISAPPRPQPKDSSESRLPSELIQYLSARNRDDAATQSLAQRATDEAQRARLAEQRLAMDDVIKRGQLSLAQVEEQRKAAADAETAKLNAARIGDLTAKTKARSAAAGAAKGTTEDILYDDITLEHNRKSPDKSTNTKQQESVAEKASAWSEVGSSSERLAKSLETWAKAPSIAAKNDVMLDVSMAAQGLTRALGGGAMAEHEKKIAFSALGAELTDPSQIEALIKSMLSDPKGSEEAAKQMSQRARRLKAAAKEDVVAFARSQGYDPKKSADSSGAPAASTDMVTVTVKATGKKKRISAADAEILRKAGDVE